MRPRQRHSFTRSASPASLRRKLRAPLHVVVSTEWPKATVHRSEYAKVLAGEPTEINPSVGAGARSAAAAKSGGSASGSENAVASRSRGVRSHPPPRDISQATR